MRPRSPKPRRREDLAAQMFLERLCLLGLCDYGTSPRYPFPTPEFRAILPALILKWKEFHAAWWSPR